MAEPKRNADNDRVFFITSNQSKLEPYIKYKIKDKFARNLQCNLIKEQMYKRENFIVHVFSFEVFREELKEKDPIVKAYKAVVTLNYKKDCFEGIIFFKEKKKNLTNFIYDLEFKEYLGWFGNKMPLPSIKFSKKEQLRIYNEMFKKLKIKQSDPISNILITDSICQINQKFYFDFYLEILRACFSNTEVKLLLIMFNLQKVLLPEKMEKKNYISILNMIENNPNLILKHLGPRDSKDLYLKHFYTLLLFFKLNYDNDKVQSLLINEDLWKYYAETLPKNYKFFTNLDIPDALIIKMLKKEPIKFDTIIGALSFGGSIEKILTIINNNIDLISSCCLKENNKINMSEMENPNQKDNLNNIINEIEKILKYQEKTKKIFILFDEDFWNNYIHYNDKKNIKNLVLINKAIYLCKKCDTKLNPEKLELKQKIHDTGLEAIEKGILKNIELIEFIENDDIYFKGQKYESRNFRPLEILKGIDLESVDDKFYKSWNESTIFKIFSFCDYDFKKNLINKVDDMKDFGKLLKLFNYKDNKIFDFSTSSLLREKFKNIIKTYKIETCPNFIKDVSFFIYIMDQRIKDIKHFMETTIEKYIQSVQTITDIYLYLFSNYKDITKDVIDCITNYFTNNKDKLNGESILFLLKKFNSRQFVKSILNKINACVIKEEQLFSHEKDIDTFKLLQGIENEELLVKFPELQETNYLMSTLNLRDGIMRKIEKGEYRFKSLYSMWIGKDKKDLMKERLNIILFNNKDDVDKCVKYFDKQFLSIIKITTIFKKLKAVLKEFYESTHQENIKLLAAVENQINEGKLNEIEKENLKQKIDKLNKLIPDLDKQYKLKTSIFFTSFFKAKKAKYILKKEEDIFKDTMVDFNKLKSFFEANWINNIDELIIKECYKALKNQTDESIKKELKFLRDYFELKNITDLDLVKLQDEIKIFSKKEEIFQTANSCLHFISEFKVKQTEFYDLLLKLRSQLSKNISVEQIREYGQSLEKFGINILDQKEDKDYISILQALYSKKGSLSFIMGLSDEDCRTLQEVVLESESTFLTGAEIRDMTTCSNFVHNMNIKKDITTDQELIKIFIE